MISITVKGVSKSFGPVVALHSLDLDIPPGELFFLLGPSGCGKTTLLRCMAGFYAQTTGRIYFGDEDITDLPPHKRNAGMMFQSYALWPHLTVAQNVAFGLQERRLPKPEIRERVREALASVQMDGYGERKPNQLSGGQQQRVALARALVIRPRCLLLDEPLSNLDAKLRLEMRGEIRRVCKEFNLTTVYVTHDQKEALSIADRIAVLDKGRLLQVGTPAEIYRRPSSRFTANFIGETNFLEGEIVRAGSGMASVRTACGEFQGVVTGSDSEPADGTKALLSVRPECWKVSRYPSDDNTVSGRIGDSVYLGEVAQYAFNLNGSGVSLKILEVNPRFAGDDAKGDLYATVDPEDVVVIPET